MKFLVTAIAIFLCGSAFSQIYTPVNPTTYGEHNRRSKTDSAQHIPEKDSLRLLTVDTTAQIFVNKRDSSVWAYYKPRGFWKIGEGLTGAGGGIDSVVAGYGLVSINDSTIRVDTTLISTRLWRQKGIDSVVALINQRVKYSDTSNMLLNYITWDEMVDSSAYQYISKLNDSTILFHRHLGAPDTLQLNLAYIVGSGGGAWGTITGTLSDQTDLNTALSGKQSSDADLTAIAGLSPTNDDLMQFKSGAWSNRTISQVKTDFGITTVGNNFLTLTNPSAVRYVRINADNSITLRTAAEILSDIGAQTALSGTGFVKISGTTISYDNSTYQPLDGDLTTIAGLTATTDNFIVSVSSAWASRTPTQVKTTLSLNNVENTALSTWAGTSNITTLGTIGTGTWQGTVVGSTYGGTGVNNAGRTLTISTNSGTLAFGAASKTLTINNSIGLTGTDATTMTFPSTNANIVGETQTQTISNKRIISRTGTTTSSATPTINTDNVDAYYITAQSAAITSFTTNLSGTPNAGDKLLIYIKDDGTSRSITWGSSFENGAVTLPTATTISTTLVVGFIRNIDNTKWASMAKSY